MQISFQMSIELLLKANYIVFLVYEYDLLIHGVSRSGTIEGIAALSLLNAGEAFSAVWLTRSSRNGG